MPWPISTSPTSITGVCDQQRSGTCKPRAEQALPRGPGLPAQEVARPHVGRGFRRDGRGLGVQVMVHGGIDSEGPQREGERS